MSDPRALDINRIYSVWDNEVRAHGKAGRLTWLAGISYVVATQDQTRILSGTSGAQLVFDQGDRRSTEAAVYGRATVPLGARVEVSAGARLSHTTLAESRTRIRERDEQGEGRLALTPSAKLAWKPRPGRILYAGYDTAIREGGLTTAANGDVTPLDGDEMTTVSLGWRETHGRLRFDIGLYHSRWSSVQSDVLGPSGLIETANVGDASITGGEASLEADLARGWRIEAGAMLQSALLDPSGVPGAEEDRRLPVVPQATARLVLRHDFAIHGWDVHTALGGQYIGKGRLSFDPALDRKFGGYLDTHAGITAARGGLQVGVAVRNAADSRADVFAYGNPLRILTSNQHVGQRPRQVTLFVGWKK